MFIISVSAETYSQQNTNHFALNQFNDFGFGNFYSGSQNFIEVSYGIGELKHKNFIADFNSLSLSEIKLGRRFTKPIGGFKILQFDDNYLFSTYIDHHQNGESPEVLDISYDIWRFGFGYRKGYGYNFKNFAILPYYQLGLVWNRSNFNHPYSDIRNDNHIFFEKEIDILKKYNDAIKFGTTNITGIGLRINNSFSIGAGYETAVIFPYYKTWKQLGSIFIETLSQTGIDFLTEGVIVKHALSITPIFYFVMKNGLSYFLYTLKQEDMNWPFKTAKPITMEMIKFNLKISF